MSNRINISKIEPNAYKAIYGLENYISASGLKKEHKALIKIRASQINGCAFCLDMHTTEAITTGETLQRIVLLNAWRDTDLFTEEEKVILSITEEVTLIHQHGLSDETYELAKQFFDDHYITFIIMAVVAINAWNRIAVSTHLPVARISNFQFPISN
jgi:AhpD family alkylhydroperoxidase